MEVWVRVIRGKGLLLLEFSVNGLRTARPQVFSSPGRAIIVRNGEILPMSREFTPETERRRLQLLVSRDQSAWCVCILCRGCAAECSLCPLPPAQRHTAPSWGLPRKATA